ncbi:hypothetical protein INR49_017170 [Caranx melampygus]|nr:hypothetical protein INR49_017170 [Caranx melampygus]
MYRPLNFQIQRVYHQHQKYFLQKTGLHHQSLLKSPPSMVIDIVPSGAAAYRETKYTFEVAARATDSDDEWVVVSVSDTEDDNLCYSPESTIDYRPMSPDSAMLKQEHRHQNL